MPRRALAGRKMAGKKGQAVQLQAEINTDEEWNELLKRSGLLVVDVYSEWCGPCLGMVGTLKKIKLEIGGDLLNFAIARSDDIEALERFRNRSEPTWMFIAGGQLVNLMFGADAPRLVNLIQKELEKERAVHAREATRTGMPFTELTPEERVRQEEKEKIRNAAKAQEEAMEANAKAVALRKEIRNLIKYIEGYTVIIIMPFIFEDGIGQAWQELSEELNNLGYKVQDDDKITLTEEVASEVIFGGMQEITEEFQEVINAGLTVVKLVFYQPPEEEEAAPPPILEEGEEPPEEEEPEEEVAVQAAETDAIFGVVRSLYGCAPPEEGKPFRMEPECIAMRYRKGPDVPALWTPLTPHAKATAIMKLFPRLAEKYKLPPAPTLPPVLTLVFDAATKSADINELIGKGYENEVIAMGYFTGVDPSTAKKIAATEEQYKQRRYAKEGETLVLVLSRKRSDPVLTFCAEGPVYVSNNVEDGKKDFESFFPEDEEEEAFYEEPESEPEFLPTAAPDEDAVSEHSTATTSEYGYAKAEEVKDEYGDIEGLSAFEVPIDAPEPEEPPKPAEEAPTE